MIRRDAHSAEMIALEQDCLCCYFGDREDVKEADRAVMEQLGLQFRGRNQWIFFRALKPGRSPWFLNAEQAELMISALQNLFMLCRLLMEGRFRPDFDAGETMIRWFDPQKNLWLNDVVRMRKPKLERRLTFADGSELDGLKQREKTAVRLEIDSFYFPVQVWESKNEPPVSPYEALLVDRRSGLILDQRFAKPGEPEHMVVISVLLNYVHQYGRPSIVYVRSNWVGALVRSACEELGIRLIDNKGVPVLDDVLDTMLSRSRQ